MASLKPVMSRFVTYAIAVLFSFCSEIAAGASIWDLLPEQPGAAVKDSKDNNGDEIRDVELPSGVWFRLQRRGDKIESTGIDKTGKGAVLCMWEIYISLRSHLKVCPAPGDEAIITRLDTAIGRVNGFIIENSVPPVTRSELENTLLLREQRTSSKLATIPKDKICAGEGPAFFSKLRVLFQDDWERRINDLLSIKRPPVMNPCL